MRKCTFNLSLTLYVVNITHDIDKLQVHQMWKCKDCNTFVPRRSELLKHYKLEHRHFGGRHLYPCIHLNCPCTCKTWKALLTHLSRFHQSSSQTEVTTLKCLLCNCNQLSNLKDYFQHIAQHLKNSETVVCVFQGCSYRTNIYGSFRTHRSRNHKHCSLNDLKTEILEKHQSSLSFSGDCIEGDSVSAEPSNSLNTNTDDFGVVSHDVSDVNDLAHNVELKVASVLLKLEHIYLVPGIAVDELLQEFDYLISTASVPIVQQTIAQHLEKSNCQVNETVLQDLALTICKSNPISGSFGGCSPLSTAWKRKIYYKKHFKTVEPIEFVLDSKSRKSFQYISILDSLRQLLSCQSVLDETINLISPHQSQSGKIQYNSFYDGSNYIENKLLSKDCAISLILYVDDFEICNPLGTSKKNT